MTIPTEPIGSIPRPPGLIRALASRKGRDSADPSFDPLFDDAIRDTIAQFEATGSPVITDGEQRKYHNFWTYCVGGLAFARAEDRTRALRAGYQTHAAKPIDPAELTAVVASLTTRR
jgi:5-methyltetrahydropteroyltriglutamate--homocysteine methyltransferase